jgi:broad specificity phosphatase PhoE
LKIKNIYLIRHGETDWNRDQRFQGQTDIPLNQTGREQAEQLVTELQDLKIDCIYSSPLSRAYETAQIATSYLQIQILKESRLKETNIGGAEGLTFQEIEEKFGQHIISRWRSYEERDLDFKYPNGESKRQLMFRVREAILEIAQTPGKNNIAVFAHGMVMRALTFAFHQGVPWDHHVFSNGSIHHFLWDESRSEFLKYQGKINGRS